MRTIHKQEMILSQINKLTDINNRLTLQLQMVVEAMVYHLSHARILLQLVLSEVRSTLPYISGAAVEEMEGEALSQ